MNQESAKESLYDFFMQAPAILAILKGPGHVFEFANPAYIELIGNRDPTGKNIREALPELEGQGFYELLDNVYKTGETFIGKEVPVKLDKGKDKLEEIYVNFSYQASKNSKGEIDGILVFALDVTGHVEDRQRVEEYNHVLEMITSGTPLHEALDFLMHSIEKQSRNGMKGSILLLDEEGMHLLHGAAPSLPQDYNNAINGIEIGDGVGSCGTAAFTQKPVFVTDIATDPLWKDFKDLAMGFGLRSCWSTPIFSSEHKLLGTFALYYHQPLSPGAHDKQIIDFATRTASLIIERSRIEKELKASEQRYRFMAEAMPQKVWTADVNGNINYVNKNWIDYTAKSFDELKGWGWTGLIHPVDKEETLKAWKHSLESGSDFQFEHRFKNKDGEYHWHLSRGIPQKDKNGNILMWLGTNTDIHDLKKVQEQLTQAYEDLEVKIKFRNIDLERENNELKKKLTSLSDN